MKSVVPDTDWVRSAAVVSIAHLHSAFDHRQVLGLSLEVVALTLCLVVGKVNRVNAEK